MDPISYKKDIQTKLNCSSWTNALTVGILTCFVTDYKYNTYVNLSGIDTIGTIFLAFSLSLSRPFFLSHRPHVLW